MNLLDKARWTRLKVLEIANSKGIGHLGGTFSCVDLLVSLYYGGFLKKNDKFILSKGHACLALYSILVDLGILDQLALESYGINGGLGAQLDINVPGIDWNTGSLGHSIGICAGISLSAQLDGTDAYAYTIIGDAELAEGSVWEAISFAGGRRLANLVVIVDRNRLSVTEVLPDDSFFGELPNLCKSFGWNSQVIDGHNFPQIIGAFEMSKSSQLPTIIIANTIKGKGVSFMENKVQWHHGKITEDENARAMKELLNE